MNPDEGLGPLVGYGPEELDPVAVRILRVDQVLVWLPDAGHDRELSTSQFPFPALDVGDSEPEVVELGPWAQRLEVRVRGRVEVELQTRGGVREGEVHPPAAMAHRPALVDPESEPAVETERGGQVADAQTAVDELDLHAGHRHPRTDGRHKPARTSVRGAGRSSPEGEARPFPRGRRGPRRS